MKNYDPENDLIEKPTWHEHIKHLFTNRDAEKMLSRFDLKYKEDVEDKYDSILSRVSRGVNKEGVMPPKSEERYWKKNKVQTFENWEANDFKLGNPYKKSDTLSLKSSGKPTTRIRKEIRELYPSEIKKLKKAFTEIMKRPGTDANSYFVLAGIHGLPIKASSEWNPLCNKKYCEHRTPLYHLWHRAYLYEFENALRSVEGCEDVTLPYWNFENTEDFPSIFNEAPFDKYVIPYNLNEEYKKGYTTSRYNINDVLNSYKNKVTPLVQNAKKEKTWDTFRIKDSTTGVIPAHDTGHMNTGESFRDSDIAAFDPLFWFFHCNWDRIWWEWQGRMGAKTKEGMRAIITQKSLAGPFRREVKLKPFRKEEGEEFIKSTEIVNSAVDLEVDYEHPKEQVAFETARLALGTIKNNKSLNFDNQNISIRIKGINKIKIKGSFFVILKGKQKNTNNEEILAKHALFQGSSPEECENCVENAIVNFDFVVPIDQMTGKELSVEIESSDTEQAHKEALEKVTINARLLAFQD